MTNPKRARVLVVDDVESIRTAIAEYLATRFDTCEAVDGVSALELLEQKPIDILVTDIRMPRMGGEELCRQVQNRYPHIQIVLMTAYNVDDYIHFARQAGIWNLIPKSTDLDLHYIRVMIEKLHSGNIFGVQQYFPDVRFEQIGLAELYRIHKHKRTADLRDVFFEIQIASNDENHSVCDKLSDFLVEQGAPSVVRMVLEELSANAMIHAPRIRQRLKEQILSEESLSQKEIQLDPEKLPDSDSFTIGFGILADQVVFSVVDSHGAFDKDAALLCLERQTTLDPQSGLPIGLADYHGRGLYISREKLDQLIFNLQPGHKTEIIGILDIHLESRTRAISIFETH